MTIVTLKITIKDIKKHIPQQLPEDLKAQIAEEAFKDVEIDKDYYISKVAYEAMNLSRAEINFRHLR